MADNPNVSDPLIGGITPGASVAAPLPKFLTRKYQGLIKRYPKFPQKKLMEPRQSTDYITNGLGSFSFVDHFALDGSPSFRDGRKVIRIDPSTGGNSHVRTFLFPKPMDMRGGHGSVWICMEDYADANLNLLNLRFYSSGSPTGAEPSAYHACLGKNDHSLKAVKGGGFAKVGAPFSQMTAVGGGADISAITWAAVTCRGSGTPFPIFVSDMQMVPNPRNKAFVIWTRDDAFRSPQVTALFKSFGKPMVLMPGAVTGPNGFNGAGYNTPPVNNPSRLSIDEVNELRALGWQVGTQAGDTENVQPDQASTRLQYLNMQQYYWEQQWADDAADGSEHSSVSSSTPYARQAMIEAGSRTIRSFTNGRNFDPPLAYSEAFPFIDETKVLALNLGAPGLYPTANINTITDSLMRSIDQAVAAKTGLIVAGHDDLETVPAELEALRVSLIRERDVGDFESHTFNSLLDPWLALYGGTDYEAPNF